LLLIAATLVVTQTICFGLAILPTDWDTRAYHLPLITHWIQNGDLFNTGTGFWYVPGNHELLGYYFTSLFSGDFWAQFANAPVILLLGATTIALCRELNLSKRVTNWICFVVLVNPVVLRQAHTLENDVAVTALFLTGTFWGIRAVKSGRLEPLVLCGLSTGLLAGTKYYALAYMLVVAGTVTLMIALRYGIPGGLRAMIIFMLGFILLGAFWYGRNFLITGTPLYPKGVSFLGLPGPWDERRPDFAQTCLALGIRFSDVPKLSFAWVGFAGPLVALTFLLCPFMCLVSVILLGKNYLGTSRNQEPPSATNSGHPIDSLAELTLILCTMGGLASYLVTPNVLETHLNSRNMLNLQYHPVRFGMTAAVLSLITFAHIASWVSSELKQSVNEQLHQWIEWFAGLILRKVMPAFAIFAAALALMPKFGWQSHFRESGLFVWLPNSVHYDSDILMLVTIDIGLALATLAWLVKSPSKIRHVLSLCLVGIACIVGTAFLSPRWHSSFDDHFDSIGPISLKPPLGETISQNRTLVCEYRYYATFGSRRENEVFRPLIIASESDLKRYIKEHHAEAIVTLREDTHWSTAYTNCYHLLSDSRSEFTEVDSTDQYAVFVRRDANSMNTLSRK